MKNKKHKNTKNNIKKNSYLNLIIKLKNRKEFSQFTVFFFLSCIFFTYNNCSQQGNQFATSNAVLNSLKEPSVIIEDGKTATHNRLIKLNLVNFNQEIRGLQFKAKNMRISLEDQIDSAQWVPFKESFVLDLNDHYASDGNKDGYKNIVVQVINEDQTSITVKGSILLDTLPPKISGKGILVTGLKNGQLYTKGTGVVLDWDAEDQTSPMGLSSGLSNEEGLSLAWSLSGDCSENNLKDKTPWVPFSKSKQFVWPQSNLLETFFICISIKDIAGNSSTILSQPMSSVWGVYGGDNNLGNGGSVLAPNVRFSYPARIAADSKGQIFVYDNYVKTFRTIKQNGIIEHFVGTGLNSGPIEGSNVASISVNSVSGIDFDSNDNLFFAGGSGVWKVDRNPTTGAPENFTKLYNGDSHGVVIKRDPLGDVLYFNQYNNIEAGQDPSTAHSYIFKIKLDELIQLRKTLGKVPTYDSLINNYVVVGNGSINLSTNVPKYGVAYDPLSTPIGYIQGMGLTENNDLYFVTSGDGLGRGFGSLSLQVLKQSDSEPKVYLLAGGEIDWRWGVTPIAMNDELHLILTGAKGLVRYRIDNINLPLTKGLTKLPVPNDIKEFSFSTAVISKINNESLERPLILTANASAGQIVQVSPDFISTNRFGRPLFNEFDVNAQNSILGNPAAISEDSQGNIYIFETLNNIIRKITPNNEIKLFAGQPDGISSPIDYGSPFQNLVFYGGSYEYEHRFQMVLDENKNIIYLGNGSNHSINQFKLNDNSYNNIDLSAKNLDPSVPDTWPVFGLAIDNTTVESKLWVYRYNRLSPNGAMGMELSDLESNLPKQRQLFGNQNVGTPDTQFVLEPLLKGVNSIALDKKGSLFFVSNGSLWKFNSNGIKKIVSSGVSATSIVTINENSLTHVVTGNSNLLRHYVVDANDKVTVNETLCVPGSFVNNPGQIVVSHDGNLLIADANNNRVLKYYIRNQSGELLFVNSSACK